MSPQAFDGLEYGKMQVGVCWCSGDVRFIHTVGHLGFFRIRCNKLRNTLESGE